LKKIFFGHVVFALKFFFKNGARRSKKTVGHVVFAFKYKWGSTERGGSTGESPMRGIDRDGDRQRGESTGESPKRGIDREGDRQPL